VWTATLFVPPGESKEILERELKAAHRAGLTAVETVERAPIADFDMGAALRFPRQAQFHPLKYLSGLARAITQRGGQIFTGTHASKIEGGKPARIETGGGSVVTADAVVVATNTPVNDRFAIHTKQAAYLTYVIGARVPRGSVTKALYWDTPDPYHYVRIQEGPFGEGAILRSGLTKVAVYRDESATAHVRSAICPHLGCVVQWNSLEKTWDCPCHGSRSDSHGKVFQGPANRDLARVDED
jgi:Rieske Fe-S protein